MQNTKTSVSEAAGQIYKNLKMGESALLDLLPKAENDRLRAEMIQHLEAYQQASERAKALLDERHEEAKEAGAFAKLSAKMGTMLNTAMDSTSSHIAEMIIEGSTMGITDHTRILHELERSDLNSEPDLAAVRDLAKDVIALEEAQIEKMKVFL